MIRRAMLTAVGLGLCLSAGGCGTVVALASAPMVIAAATTPLATEAAKTVWLPVRVSSEALADAAERTIDQGLETGGTAPTEVSAEPVLAVSPTAGLPAAPLDPARTPVTPATVTVDPRQEWLGIP